MSDMTLAQAAKAVGKSPVTLRAAVNNQKLKSYQKGRVHYVNLNDVVALFAERSKSDSKVATTTQTSENSAIVSAMQAQIDALQSEREFLRKLIDQEKTEKSHLMRELLQRTAEIKAFLENKPGIFDFLKR